MQEQSMLASKNRVFPRRTGLTLIDVVLMIGMVIIVLGIALPWMQASRVSARRTRCELHLMHIAMALDEYYANFNLYPAGTINSTGPVCNQPVGFAHSWLGGLIGTLDPEMTAPSIDANASVYAESNRMALEMLVPTLRCPSFRTDQVNLSNYAGNTGSAEVSIAEGNDGVFFLNRFLRHSDIVNGRDQTLFVGEKLPLPQDLGWLSGTRSSLRNGGHAINEKPNSSDLTECYVGGFASQHPGGANFLMGSGRWSFLSESIDPELLRQMSRRRPLGEQ